MHWIWYNLPDPVKVLSHNLWLLRHRGEIWGRVSESASKNFRKYRLLRRGEKALLRLNFADIYMSCNYTLYMQCLVLIKALHKVSTWRFSERICRIIFTRFFEYFSHFFGYFCPYIGPYFVPIYRAQDLVLANHVVQFDENLVPSVTDCNQPTLPNGARGW